MRSLTVRNIPKDVHNILRRSAKQHRRSVNAEIVLILGEGARKAAQRAEAGDLISQLRQLREKVARKFPVNYESVDLIREARDNR